MIDIHRDGLDDLRFAVDSAILDDPCGVSNNCRCFRRLARLTSLEKHNC
jgi:hypothetical protein